MVKAEMNDFLGRLPRHRRQPRIDPDRRPQSTPTKGTSSVTCAPTARVTLESVGQPVSAAVTLTVSCQRRSSDSTSRFRPAPTDSKAVMDTATSSLIPPSQPRRKGSASRLAKTDRYGQEMGNTLVRTQGASRDRFVSPFFSSSAPTAAGGSTSTVGLASARFIQPILL